MSTRNEPGADLLARPHLNVDVSGVLFAGLAFGKAMVMSDVGGFRELVDDHGAGVLVPPGDRDALAGAISRLLAEPAPDPAFEIDADLRPEGRQGALVRSLDSYREYYQRWMSVWEAQALLRARPVAGDAPLLVAVAHDEADDHGHDGDPDPQRGRPVGPADGVAHVGVGHGGSQ